MKKLITVCIALTLSVSAFSQIEATTSDGKKVLLQTNGTWSYAEEKPVDLSTLDCSSIIKIQSDKVTGKDTRYYPAVISRDDKNGLVFNAIQFDGGNVILLISAVGAGACVDDDQKANILFTDGSRMEVTNMGDFNCKGQFTLRLGPSFRTKKETEAFRTKQISTVRVWTSDGYVEEDFPAEESAKFRMAIECMLSAG